MSGPMANAKASAMANPALAQIKSPLLGDAGWRITMMSNAAQYAAVAMTAVNKKWPPSKHMPPSNRTMPCATAVLTTGLL